MERELSVRKYVVRVSHNTHREVFFARRQRRIMGRGGVVVAWAIKIAR